MAANKRQHFLPCCYLKFFSIDGTWGKPRKTQIFFTDGVKSQRNSVINLGVESYTYSRDNPEFDKQFQKMEGNYPLIVEKMLGGQI